MPMFPRPLQRVGALHVIILRRGLTGQRTMPRFLCILCSSSPPGGSEFRDGSNQWDQKHAIRGRLRRSPEFSLIWPESKCRQANSTCVAASTIRRPRSCLLSCGSSLKFRSSFYQTSRVRSSYSLSDRRTVSFGNLVVVTWRAEDDQRPAPVPPPSAPALREVCAPHG